ncbi:MAG: oxygen-independent coproporphyrinogen III oxidase [Alphaproteobacteria bacterium]|nr:oxygen-independent coproporphyrinogen III oxidase [Alphaproteobacteria bacterium]
MKPEWTAFATAKVPRYTSYPTAAQFTADVDAGTADDWARATCQSSPISAYVHVPFCEQLCWYCGCHTTVPNGYERIARYVSTLHREIDLWAGALGRHGGVGHLHFGGGSPNALSGDDFFAVSEHLRQALRLRDDAEIAVELDPRALTPERIRAMAAAGVNRASLGVQTLDPQVQKAVNRIQPRELIQDCIEGLRIAGIAAINVDLMYGLPHQTIGDLEDMAAFCAHHRISRIAVFGYAHVPWFAKHQKAIDEAALPGLKQRSEQAEAVAQALQEAGYQRIGLDHFARPDDPLAIAAREHRLRRNFQGYTDDPYETLVGIGPSAISAFKHGFAQNTRRSDHWGEAVQAGRLPTEKGVAISDEDRLRARVIEALMCDLQADMGAICTQMGYEDFHLDQALVSAASLSAHGLCEVRDRVVRVPGEARMLIRNVARCFDQYLPDDTVARHALAV